MNSVGINNLLLLSCLLNILFVFKTLGQQEVIIKRKLIFTAPLPQYMNSVCDYEFLVPASRPGKQDLISTKYNIEPNYLIKAPENELIAKWDKLYFSDVLKKGIEVEIKLNLYCYDLKTAKKNPIIDKDDLDTLTYLKNEENFQSNSVRIKEVAETILGTTREEIVHDIFDFVTFRLDYKKFGEQNRGAKKALKQGQGDCTEYSELMVALCRAKNIPARIQMGLVIKKEGEIGYHNWVEVFFSDYGWVSFDPTWADAPSSSTTFDSMLNRYIHLSNRRYIRQMFCSCNFREYSFTYKLKDTWSTSKQEERLLSQRMIKLYNSDEFLKAIPLLDTLISYKSVNAYNYYAFEGIIYARTGEYERGLECLQIALSHSKSDVEKSNTLYAFANYFALKGDNDFAVSYLKKAIELGFNKYDVLDKDIDFNKINKYPPFVELKKEFKSKSAKNNLISK